MAVQPAANAVISGVVLRMSNTKLDKCVVSKLKNDDNWRLLTFNKSELNI